MTHRIAAPRTNKARHVLVTLAAGLFWGGAAAHASVRTQYELLPVQIQALPDGKSVGVHELPCGANSMGVVLRKHEGAFLTAAVIRHPEVQCLGMPTMATISLDFLTLEQGARFASLPQAGSREGKIIMLSPSEIRRSAGALGPVHQAIYESRCGELVGPAMQRTPSGQLEVSVVEWLPPGRKAGHCDHAEEVLSLDHLGLEPSRRLSPWSNDSGDGDPSLKLQLSSQSSTRLERLAGGVIALHYTRRCHEAPIGVVMTEPRRRLDDPRQTNGSEQIVVRVGLVLASYMNMPCKGKPQSDVFATTDLQIPAGVTLEVVTAEDLAGSALRVKSPTQFSAKAQRGAVKGVEFDYIAGCDEFVGGLYARDEHGNLAVSVLERVSPTVECTQPAREKTLFQGFVTKGEADFFPLKIRGRVEM